ncbi:MAG: GntR family transcriptional regulator [Variovorax sp.]
MHSLPDGGTLLRRPTQTHSLAGHAAEQIRRKIVDGTLELGQALSETALAAELGVSKTPVREALQRLETEGLVQILPQRGTFVFPLSEVDAHALGEFRCMLEVEALRIAMRRDTPALAAAMKAIVARMRPARTKAESQTYRALDDALHRTIIAHGHNPYLTNAYENIALLVQTLRNRLQVDVRVHEQSLKDHKALVRFVEKGQFDKAVALLKSHIAKTPADYARRLALQCDTRGPVFSTPNFRSARIS